MLITTLADRPDLVFTVARWLWEGSFKKRGLPMSWSLSALDAHLGAGTIPATLIYLDRGEPLGALGLVAHMPGDTFRPEHSPWITHVYVVPEARGQGLGEHMVKAALCEANQDRRPLVLAVDARNHVARRIYERAGFLELTVQSVHLRQAAPRRPVLQFTDYAHPPEAGKRKS